MRGAKPLSCLIMITYFLIYPSFLSTSTVECLVYNVGDSENWNTGVNYLSWLHKYNFSVGDTLVFNYVLTQHNTCVVTQATYQSCNSSSGVLARYESGNDQIVLNEAKKYWFICDVPGHCSGGMRFGINVNDHNNDANNTAPDLPVPGMDQNSGTKTRGASLLIYSIAALLAFLLNLLHNTP
ncbi:basic blue protein-like [Heracleum sosnowskyi]|uniref:Basic blue protein-like n=1 Tax=Heracleum sosnowskyi TaxID=360622 RepID=A0AAD8MT67_9APIA|nr:basic blue protein-like [Heracleum sosnowskyi]